MQLELDEYVSGGFAPAMMKLLHCIALIWFCLCFYSHSSPEAYLDPQNLSPLSALLRIRFVIKLGYFRQLKEVVQNIVILGNDLQKVTDTSYKLQIQITNYCSTFKILEHQVSFLRWDRQTACSLFQEKNFVEKIETMWCAITQTLNIDNVLNFKRKRVKRGRSVVLTSPKWNKVQEKYHIK